jgi:hypothetical protein
MRENSDTECSQDTDLSAAIRITQSTRENRPPPLQMNRAERWKNVVKKRKTFPLRVDLGIGIIWNGNNRARINRADDVTT